LTLLDKMAEAVGAGLAHEDTHEDVRRAVANALTAVLIPTRALVNAGGLKAFSGPQPEGGPPMIYPAAIWREMVSFILEERDRERPEDESEHSEETET
jgi:hypothetical protein